MRNNTTDRAFATILAECHEDYVGLWSIIYEVKRCLPAGASYFEETIKLIERLILEEDVVAGDFATGVAHGFRQWEMPAEATIERIRCEWQLLGHEPTPGDVVWLTKR